MRTVWVFRIDVNVLTASFTNTFQVPVGAQLLHCREQDNSIALWFQVDEAAPTESRGFQIFGTGTGPIREGLTYVGTCLFAEGSLVLHVYEIER